jgi:hypothetical protein
MEFDDPAQLMFNLLAIVAITSLALFCILLNRDKNKLITGLKQRLSQKGKQPKRPVILEAKPVPEPSPTATPEAPPATEQDIRQFVARRIDDWTARS